MKKKHFVYLAVIVISLSIIGGIQHFFNGDPVKKELEGLLQNTKNDTFPVIDEHDTDKYHEKAMKFKEKSALMTKGSYFDIAGGSLKSPKGIVCTDQGIVITDYDANCLYLVDFSGHIQQKIGELGNGPNQFQKPTGCTYHKEHYYIIDSGNSRIVVLDRQFNYTDELPLPKSEREPEKEFTDLAINDNGDIYTCGDFLYDSGIYLFDKSKKKFINIHKHFYGNLKSCYGKVYGIEQFRIYINLDNEEIGGAKGLNSLWILKGKEIHKRFSLPVGLSTSTFDIFDNNLIICSPFHSAVMAFNMNDGEYISNIYEVDKMDYKTYASIYGSDLYITEPEKGKILKISLEKLQ